MLNYLDIGKDNSQTILLLHGLGQCKESWNNQHPLTNDYRLIIPDLMGHGESVDIEKPITIENMALSVIELLECLNIKYAHIVGLSLGGIVAQEILKSNPDIVQSITLSNTASLIPHSLGTMVVKERERKLNSMNDEEYIRSVVRNCLYNKNNEQLIDEMSAYFKITDKNTYLETARAAVGVNYLPTLMLNSKPTLIISSLYDKVTPFINALTMKMFCPMAKLKIFDSCGHLPNVEKAQEFNDVVLKFLKEHK